MNWMWKRRFTQFAICSCSRCVFSFWRWTRRKKQRSQFENIRWWLMVAVCSMGNITSQQQRAKKNCNLIKSRRFFSFSLCCLWYVPKINFLHSLSFERARDPFHVRAAAPASFIPYCLSVVPVGVVGAVESSFCASWSISLLRRMMTTSCRMLISFSWRFFFLLLLALHDVWMRHDAQCTCHAIAFADKRQQRFH